MSHRLTAFVLLALAVTMAGRAPAQDVAPAPSVRYPYEFGVSSVAMVRNAQLLSAAGAVTDRAIGGALDKATGGLFEDRGAKGVAARFARLWFLDMPIASLAQAFDHEYGHLTRSPWATLHGIRVSQWPWPVPTAGLRIEQQVNGPSTMREWFDSAAGGVEADHLLADQQLDRMYAAGAASPFDAVLYVYGKVYPSYYIFTWPQPGYDPYEYAATLAQLRAWPFADRPGDAQRQLGSMRTGAWLNLLDYALMANVERLLADYAVRAHSVIRPPWLRLGRVRLAPGVTYTPTPSGPQYRVNCRLGVGATIANTYVRWTEPLRSDDVWPKVQTLAREAAQRQRTFLLTLPIVVRLVGAGGQVRLSAVRGVTPTIVADVWRDTDGHLAARGEFGLSVSHRVLGRGQAVVAAIGAKGTGYLPGFPTDSGFYVTAALRTVF